MKKIMLFFCVFSLSLTFNSFAMEDAPGAPIMPTKEALLGTELGPTDDSPEALVPDAQFETEAEAIAFALLERELGTKLSSQSIAQLPPAQQRALGQKLLEKMDGIIQQSQKRPKAFADAQSIIATLKEKRGDIAAFVKQSRGYNLPPQIYAEGAFTAAQAIAKITCMLAPALLKTKSRCGYWTVVSLVAVTAVTIGAIGLSNAFHVVNVQGVEQFFWDFFGNVTKALTDSL